MKKKEEQANESRRDFIKKAAYVPPAVITLAAMPTMHAHGSVNQDPGTTEPGSGSGGISG